MGNKNKGKKRRRAGLEASALEALSPTGVESDVAVSGSPSAASAAPTPPGNAHANDPDDPSTWSKSKKKRMKQKRKKEAIKAANARKKSMAAEEDGEERTKAASAARDSPGRRPGGTSGAAESPSKPLAPNGKRDGPPQKPEAGSPKRKKQKQHEADGGQNPTAVEPKQKKPKPASGDGSKEGGSPKKKKPKHSAQESERDEPSSEEMSNRKMRDGSPKPKKQKLHGEEAGKPKSSPKVNGTIGGDSTQEREQQSGQTEAGQGVVSPKKKKRKKKKRKTGEQASASEEGEGKGPQPQPKQQGDATTDKQNDSGKSDTSSTAPKPSPRKIALPRQSRMSSLQKAFLERLTSSRFRELNEELYTQPSAHSLEHFTENPELFDQYHVGFRRQAAEWPVNPVDVIYKKIVRECSNEKKGGENGGKTDGGRKPVVVADFGCGDAKLAERLLALQVGKDGRTLEQAASKKKKEPTKDSHQCPFEVHSFDLVSGGNKLVTAADMANVPLDDESVDVAVYCLALMGTNVADFVREAWRVLKVGGVLRVAEVRSRFETAAPAKEDHGKRGKLSSGKRHRTKAKPGQKNGIGAADYGDDGAPKPLMLLDEFLALMERCGFKCTNMDRSNKMFLFMDFAKAKGGAGGLSEKERFSAKPCIYKRR